MCLYVNECVYVDMCVCMYVTTFSIMIFEILTRTPFEINCKNSAGLHVSNSCAKINRVQQFFFKSPIKIRVVFSSILGPNRIKLLSVILVKISA